MSIREEQVDRLLEQILNSGATGKLERFMIYSESRFRNLGEEFTMFSLNLLVESGLVKRVDERKRKYKSVTEREQLQNMRYFSV